MSAKPQVATLLLLSALSSPALALYTWVDEAGKRHVSTVPRACIDDRAAVSAAACGNLRPGPAAASHARHAALKRDYERLKETRATRWRALERRHRRIYGEEATLAQIGAARLALTRYLDADRALDRYRSERRDAGARAAREELWRQFNQEFDGAEERLKQAAFDAARLAEIRRTEQLIRDQARRRTRILRHSLLLYAPRRLSKHHHQPGHPRPALRIE